MDRIEAAAKAIAETFFKATAWEELFQSVRDGCIQAARDASAVLSDEPSYKKCGKVAQTFIAREGSFFPCALEEGHQGNCLQSGTCFRHGVYFGKNCPHWPTCAADARTPQEVLSGVGAALSQATPQQPLRCQSCGTTADKTKPYHACGKCGAMLIEQHATPSEAQRHCTCALKGDIYKAPEQHAATCPWRTNCPYASKSEVPAAPPQPTKADLCKVCGVPIEYEKGARKSKCSHYIRFDIKPAEQDVVERTERETEIFAGPYQRGLIEGYRRSAKERAGWHSWESVEKAIRAETDECSDVDKFIIDIRACLEAEPAERVTDQAVEAQTNRQSNEYRIGLDKLTDKVQLVGQKPGQWFSRVLYFDVLEQILGEHFPLMAETRGKLADAQGGNTK